MFLSFLTHHIEITLEPPKILYEKGGEGVVKSG
jgi:hypothetical protein